MRDFKGIHKITFSRVLKTHGWDLAYDLDSHMKTIDRPGVPRILPFIRLNNEGHPAVGINEETGRQHPKTLASLFCPGFCVVKAVYDPNYEDVNRRYRLVQYNDPEYRKADPTVPNEEIISCSTYGGLEALLRAFCKEWVEDEHLNCMDYFQRYSRPGTETVSAEYQERGYGMFG